MFNSTGSQNAQRVSPSNWAVQGLTSTPPAFTQTYANIQFASYNTRVLRKKNNSWGPIQSLHATPYKRCPQSERKANCYHKRENWLKE